MTVYNPLYIRNNKTGLVQNREEMILPEDAYPTLENALIFRERILRKKAFQLLGRLRRVILSQALGSTDGSGNFSGNIFSILSLESTAELQIGSVSVTVNAIVYTDNSLGQLVNSAVVHGTINYATGALTLSSVTATSAITASFNYYPSLPAMGALERDLNASNSSTTVFFDTKYAYNFSASGFVEFIPGTTWSYSLSNANSNFFWSTNYWVDSANTKIFWVTNDSGPTGDPIRYTNGTGNGTGSWINFAPTIDASGNKLQQCLIIVPFRGRMLAFNTLEGANLATSISYSNRIRWSDIGTPFDTVSAIVTVVNPNAWRDDIRGRGGYLNIPVNEDIISVGFVRDNLVIYCENSTWQLRYTGRTISPFQIEKVNTELGSFSTFSAVQFDTSLVGIGDKGVVECDSFKSELIDIKIPNLVMEHISNKNNGPKRVYGLRDYFNRIAYWTYPETDSNATFPNKRLVYNYENDSWATYTDSLTCLGTFQPISSRTWANPTGSTPSVKLTWAEANFSWVNKPLSILSPIGGNQQGWFMYLDSQTTNDPSLSISSITGSASVPLVLGVRNHNMQTGDVIKISGIPVGTTFGSQLNQNIYSVVYINANSFNINSYNSTTKTFSDNVYASPATYIGGGVVSVRDNFVITSKKFNYQEEGQNIQIGYIDILTNTTDSGAFSINMFVDYDENNPSNESEDSFFNTVVPTSASSLQMQNSTKTSNRVFCPSRGNFLTIQYSFSDEQMQNQCQESDLQIDTQVIWMRPAGRLGSI